MKRRPAFNRTYTLPAMARIAGVPSYKILTWVGNGWLHEPEMTPGGHRRFDDTHVAAVLCWKVLGDGGDPRSVGLRHLMDAEAQHVIKRMLLIRRIAPPPRKKR
ncbi:MerR family transcriptional regulator [Xanthobacter flavus]|uniref:HTH merR-type domain-containing protein n=1 Tax=Xanthobacter flavus TaxID=281 RepID=A0A9W6CT70_XANFL|nr:hypothetical protein XFLAVUS301_30970 [Xanthobacter flavus]